MKYNRWYSSIGKILVFLFFCLFAVAIILPLVFSYFLSFHASLCKPSDKLLLEYQKNNNYYSS